MITILLILIILLIYVIKDCQCYSIRKSIKSRSLIQESALSKNWLIDKDAGFKGLGLYSDCQLIKKDTYIGQYIGEILSLKAYRKRYPTGESVYVFVLSDEESTQRRDLLYLDASDKYKSNITRYINHDNNPNLYFVITRKFDKKQKGKLIADVKFYAEKDIHYGDELLFDYGPKYKLDYDDKLSKKQNI